jgi:hypothetical protein
MLRGLLIKDNGLKINRKAMVERSGLMAVITRANMFVEKSMAGACSSGLMGPNITDYGKIIKCSEKESSVGLMAECMLANMKMIKNMEKVFIIGQMEECIKVSFLMENSMGKEFIDSLLDKKYLEYGKKAKKYKFFQIEQSLWLIKLHSEFTIIIIIN